MKFNQSQRALHPDHAFTPPPNYYNLTQQKTKILTGSLTGPIVAKQQPGFGQSSRFNSKGELLPGPGSYFSDRVEDKLKTSVKAGKIIRQYKKHGFLGGQQRSPSIPYTNFKMDEEDQEYIKELLANEDLNKSALSIKKKAEGYTFQKSPRELGKSNTKQKQEVVTPLSTIAEYAVRRERAEKVQYREQIKRTNERRAQIINLMNPEFVPSLELIQIITKRRTKYTPGPGSYNNFKDQPKILDVGVSFSNAKRFSEDKDSLVGPGCYKVKQQKKKSVTVSKSERNLYDMKLNTDLEHRFYIDPFAEVKKRQDSKLKSLGKAHPFGSQVLRFNKLQKEGPVQMENSYKAKKQSKIEQAVEMRLQKLNLYDKRHTAESEGLLGLSTMASTIQ